MTLLALPLRSARPDRLLQILSGGQRREERRLGLREDFAYRLRVEAVAEGRRDELRSGEEAVYVTGRDLEQTGIGFRHDQPLAFSRLRLVAADDGLLAMGLGDLRIEVLVRWCRFRGAAGYESGGRILRCSIDLPVDLPGTLSR
ncbi:hypothetical protein [Botrimarina hoheduenensis]|uniref:Uncharacterized protein n=1 Tax=Botrimarina hoheduenensis TaxID=2528000 RepID=A0A5C5WCF0_9BACT|nr:hypothetical protein [Botrimarina hoheduenensis]TWT47793.1 hypothetical protein Pla111_14160 [Botrimarina hoheduenensis]